MKVGERTVIWHGELSNIQDCVIGDDCTIHSHVWIGNKVIIGDRCKVQAFAFIPEGVTIQSDCFIGPHVVFTNDKFPPSPEWKKTVVGRGASIGANATIVAGVTIGRGAKIGAGATVTKNVPAGETWVGNPARPLKGGD